MLDSLIVISSHV